LPAVRTYCAKNPDIFHYEVEEIGQIAKALEMIARVKPKVLVINGGDGTVCGVRSLRGRVRRVHRPPGYA
jgi:diacylglycerol kinase family enzyme